MKPNGGVEMCHHSLLISALDGGEWSPSYPDQDHWEINPGMYWIGDWVGPKFGEARSLLTLLRNIPWIIQPWARDCAD
jgi:hypothetical protein